MYLVFQENLVILMNLVIPPNLSIQVSLVILVDLVTVMIQVNLAILVIWVIGETADSCESYYLGESVNSVDSSGYDDCGKYGDPEHSADSSESDESGDS